MKEKQSSNSALAITPQIVKKSILGESSISMLATVDQPSIRRELFMDKVRQMEKKQQEQTLPSLLQQNDQQRQAQQAALRQQALQGTLPPHLASFAAASSFPSLLQGRTGMSDATTAGLLAASSRDSATQQQRQPSAIGAADSLFLSELQNLRAAAGTMAGQQLGVPTGLLSPSILPSRTPVSNNMSVSQNPLLRATPSLDHQQTALHSNLLGGFVNSLYPFGLGASRKRSLPEQFLEQFKAQKTLGGILDAKAAEVLASHSGTKSAQNMGTSGVKGFPLPYAKRSRTIKKPSLSSFRQNWNSIKSKELRKELFLRKLHGSGKRSPSTRNDKSS